MQIEDVQEILKTISYKNWDFVTGRTEGGAVFIQVQFESPDSRTGNIERQHGRKWYISKYAVKSEIVGTCLKAVLTAEEHEARETFRYRGQPIFQTHYDVDVLAQVCAEGGDHILELRPPVEVKTEGGR